MALDGDGGSSTCLTRTSLRRAPRSLVSEVIVVTGASAGLGRAIVERFARDGSSPSGSSRAAASDWRTRERSVESLGGRALVLPLDVADADAVEHAAETVEHELGPIDGVDQQRDGIRLLADQGDAGRGVSPGDRGDVPRLRARHARGAASACCRATAASSSRSDRRSRIAASRCSRRTARRSTPSWVSTSRC